MTPIGCFCYLVRHTQYDVDDLCESLTSLYTNYLKNYDYPVYVFHENGLTQAMRDQILGQIPIPLKLVPLEFQVPEWITGAISKVGYKHMCRFFGNQVFHQSVLADHEYYCRLDSDSRILSPIGFDIFERASKEGWDYGYITDSIKDKACYAEGLWSAAGEYFRGRPQPLVKFEDLPFAQCYYTNFELCRIGWFHEQGWSEFFEYLDHCGGIYRERWGDHTIRYIGVRMMMPAARIHHFTDIHYRHQRDFNSK